MASLIVEEHPDHELLFAHQISNNSDSVHVFLATDGAANPEDYRGEGYAASGRRLEESYATLGAFGVAAENIHIAKLRSGERLRDGRLKDQQGSFAGALYNVIRQHEDITEIISLDKDGFDGHPDHIVGFEVVRSVMQALQGRRQLQHRVLVKPGSGADLVMIGDEQAKLMVIQNHISPWGGLENKQKVAWLRDEYLGSFTEEHYRFIGQPLVSSQSAPSWHIPAEQSRYDVVA